MRREIVVVMSVAAIFLSSCSNEIMRESSADTELSDSDQSRIVYTEDALQSLLKSIEGGEIKKDVLLVGKLVLGSNPKQDPSKLVIGNSFVYFGHNLDKDKYNNQTVSVKADIRHADGKTWDAQVLGHMIVNVQHVVILELP